MPLQWNLPHLFTDVLLDQIIHPIQEKHKVEENRILAILLQYQL
jgi:hypothetical protein